MATFANLTVIGDSGLRTTDGKRLLRCACVCGGEKLAKQSDLNRGFVKSCGCMRGKHPRHGKTGTKIHNAWRNMLQRCYVPSNSSYEHYGARGIKVCDRWMVFENFYADMGDVPDGLTLERADVNGNYELSNCTWADRVEQNSNKQYNIRIAFNGKQYRTVTELAQDIGAVANTLYHRLKKMSPEMAIAPYVAGAPCP